MPIPHSGSLLPTHLCGKIAVGRFLFPALSFVFLTAETALGIENRHPGDWGEMTEGCESFNTVYSAAIFNLSRWLKKGRLGGENGRGYPDLSDRHHVIRRERRVSVAVSTRGSHTRVVYCAS
jgi:hypothetical protein